MVKEKEKIQKVFIRRVFIFLKFVLSGIKIFFSNLFWKNKTVVNCISLSLFLNLSLWIYFFQNKKTGDYPIILHYNIISGVDYLGVYEKIYLIPFVGLLLILFNSILGYFLYNKEKLASYFLVFNTFVIQIFLVVSGYLIISINS
ncbi:MAG: hypothetical protein ACT6FE_02650 [Methanosarcinaceae archaeon]